MSDLDFERRVAAALHAPVAASDGARERIMHRVRESVRAGNLHRRPTPLATRSTRHSIVGLAMAASIGSVAMLSTIAPHPAAGRGTRSAALGDSVMGTLRDTLRLMRFMQEGERRYEFVADGARWAPDPVTFPRRSDDRLGSLLRVARDSN